MAERFEKLRVLFWTLTAGLLALYVFGLVLGVYSPLELGLLSVLCVVLLVLFTIHEIRLRRKLKAEPRQVDHADKERRGF